jgi:hypothetical protein
VSDDGAMQSIKTELKSLLIFGVRGFGRFVVWQICQKEQNRLVLRLGEDTGFDQK